MIEAKIVKDSINEAGVRLTTYVLTYPRFIHSEFMTHRMFSRNASSSRAIPVKKSIQMVLDNPVVPLAFTRNKAGMQGGDPLDAKAAKLAEEVWMHALFHAVDKAKMLADLDVHKQYANRILEPFSHITVVCTATDYANFFALRCHEMAQPEIHALADLMYAAYQASTPNLLKDGEWHLPFVDEPLASKDHSEMTNEKTDENGWSAEISMGFEYDDTLVKQSVARCARVSYLNHEGKVPTIEEDLKLYDRLLGQVPIHASPAEHQAVANSFSEGSGNFGAGWTQYRKTLAHENIEEFNPESDSK